MNKCKQCGKEYESKRITSSYCGPKCKQEFYRNRMKVTVTDVTVKETKSVTVTDPEQSKAEGVTNPCKYCGKQLEFAILECCYNCAIEQPAKPASPATDGHTLASRPALEFTGKMTASESERYRSASELKPGQYNSVSKLGDSHYGQA